MRSKAFILNEIMVFSMNDIIVIFRKCECLLIIIIQVLLLTIIDPIC